MERISIDKYIITPAPLTGIGWVAVQIWDKSANQYRHVSTFRSKTEAETFISNSSL